MGTVGNDLFSAEWACCCCGCRKQSSSLTVATHVFGLDIGLPVSDVRGRLEHTIFKKHRVVHMLSVRIVYLMHCSCTDIVEGQVSLMQLRLVDFPSMQTSKIASDAPMKVSQGPDLYEARELEVSKPTHAM